MSELLSSMAFHARRGAALLRRFGHDRRANVGLLFCIVLLPVLLAFGMGLDYVSAARKRDKLNAVADAAALSAITPRMMGQTPDQAKAVAAANFMAQAALVSGVTVSPANLSVSATDTSTGAIVSRKVVVNYNTVSSNVFANLLGTSALAIRGGSTSTTTNAANTDFYLMLDTSPSMAIAATNDGIATMVKNTSKQGGCAFACHQTNPAGDNLGNPGGIDNYQLARNLNVVLRMDLVTQAAQSLMDFAQTASNSNSAKYRMAISSFDTQVTPLQSLTSNLATAKTSAGNAQLLTVYKNGWLTPTNNDNDQNTDWDTAITTLNAQMPNPGMGTNNPGDSPAEFLFIVTDGVADEANGGRKMFAMGGATCAAIKARNIQIAILYTTYNPLPTNDFYNQNIKPFQPSIGPTLSNCASPGLFTEVNTGGDITSALNSLFSKAITTAHLLK